MPKTVVLLSSLLNAAEYKEIFILKILQFQQKKKIKINNEIIKHDLIFVLELKSLPEILEIKCKYLRPQ